MVDRTSPVIDLGNAGNEKPVIGPSVDPATLGGIGGTTSGNDASGSGDGGGDNYVRNADGSIKRNADGSPRKRRGRKAGNGTSARKATGDLKGSIDSLSRMLFFAHTGLALATKSPELSLDDDESKLLAEATVNVLDQFDIRPDPKVEAIVGLITVAGTIYGPRYISIKSRKAREKREKAASVENTTGAVEWPFSGVVIDGAFGDKAS